MCVYVNVSFLYFSSLFFLFLFLSFSLYLSVVPGVRVWSKKKAVARAGKAVLIEFRLIFFKYDFDDQFDFKVRLSQKKENPRNVGQILL